MDGIRGPSSSEILSDDYDMTMYFADAVTFNKKWKETVSKTFTS